MPAARKHTNIHASDTGCFLMSLHAQKHLHILSVGHALNAVRMGYQSADLVSP